MPWDDNGGDDKNGKGRNPWGANPDGGKGGGSGKNRNPWGAPGGGNRGGRGPTPPNFDDMFGRFQDGMRGMFGGGGSGARGPRGPRGGNGLSAPGGGKLILIGAGAIAALWLASGFFIINPGEQAVIQRFGAWNRTIEDEGLKYRLPAPIERATVFNVNEIRTMNVGFTGPSPARRGVGQPTLAGTDVPDESLMLTSDFNIVDLDFVVQWNITSAENFLFNIDDPENTLRKVAQSAIREIVGQTRMFSIITTERGVVADTAKQIMQEILDSYNSGINITQVLINSAEVHPDVQDAFQDVQSARQDAEDVQNRAQAYREDIIPKARGAATRVRQQAQAYQQSTIAKASGDADRFNSIYEAYLTGQDVTKERLYIETMESIMMNAQKIIMDDSAGKGVVPYLPLNEINRPKTAKAAPAQNGADTNNGTNPAAIAPAAGAPQRILQGQ